MGFRITLDIDRPVADVFAFLADGTRTPLWYEAVENAEQLTLGGVARGTRFRFLRHLPGGHVENLVEVSEFEPASRVTFTSVEGPTPFAYRYTLEEIGDKTRLRLDGEISVAGLRGPRALLAPLATRLFERGMNQNLATLKRILERPAMPHGRGSGPR